MRPNFLEALNFGGQFFCWTKLLLAQIFFGPNFFFCTQIYLLFWPKYFLSEKFFVPKICWIEHSIQVNFLGRIFLDPHFLYKKCFGPNLSLKSKVFSFERLYPLSLVEVSKTQRILGPRKILGPKKLLVQKRCGSKKIVTQK